VDEFAQSVLKSSWILVTPDIEEQQDLSSMGGFIQDYLVQGAAVAWEGSKQRYSNMEVLYFAFNLYSLLADFQKGLATLDKILSAAPPPLRRAL
jgi:hypothetical protein